MELNSKERIEKTFRKKKTRQKMESEEIKQSAYNDIEFREKCWGPYSSYAYGASAFYIPCYGKPGGLEFVLAVNQLYPEYKIHPVNNVFYGYQSGRERFESPYNMNVIGWKIDREQDYWSYKYFIDNQRGCYALSEYKTDSNKNLLNKITVYNNTKFEREIQLSYYISPSNVIKLSGLQWNDISNKLVNIKINKYIFSMQADGTKFLNKAKVLSNSWLQFPFNLEKPNNQDNPLSREKERLLVVFESCKVGEHEKKEILFNFNMNLAGLEEIRSNKTYFPGNERKINSSKGNIRKKDLPFIHEYWETLHNYQYIKSFNSNKHIRRQVPAKQFGYFAIWDGGMAAVGALEKNDELFEEMLENMPDPKSLEENIYMCSSIPTIIFAYWEMYQRKSDRIMLKKHYPKMKRLFQAFINYPEGYQGNNKDGLVSAWHNAIGWDDYPQTVYSRGHPFTWSYKKTLPINKKRTFIQAKPVASTCYAIRFAKILRLAAWSLGNENDIAYYNKLVSKMEEALNSKMWDKELQNYVWLLSNKNTKMKIVGLDSCFPLLSCSYESDKQKELLVNYITDRKKYWTKYGVTVVPMDSENLRYGYWNGNIWIPPQWFIWKAFLNIGRVDLAEKLTDNVLNLWEGAHRKSNNCWEHFEIWNGEGLGNSRFSGLSVPILSLWAARRQFGRIQSSQDVIVSSKTMRRNGDTDIELLSPFYNGKIGVSFVLRPNRKYRVSVNGKASPLNVVTDKYGYGAINVCCQKDKITKLGFKVPSFLGKR